MKIKVLYFSSLKDKLEKQTEEIDLPENSTVQNLISILKEKYPNISDSLDNVMFALNEEYVDKDSPLKDGDTVALIPPVSGG